MKKLIFVILLAICATFSIDIMHDGKGLDTVEILRDGINNCEMLNYQHPKYGYIISYPDFFERETYSEDTRFCFRHLTNIVVDSFFIDNPATLTSHATKIKRSSESIIAEGNHYENGGIVIGCKWHAKIVKTGNRWLAYRLVYEEDYEESVYRLIQIIDRWNPSA